MGENHHRQTFVSCFLNYACLRIIGEYRHHTGPFTSFKVLDQVECIAAAPGSENDNVFHGFAALKRNPAAITSYMRYIDMPGVLSAYSRKPSK